MPGNIDENAVEAAVLEAAGVAMLASSAGLTAASAAKMWADMTEESRASLRNTVRPVAFTAIRAFIDATSEA